MLCSSVGDQGFLTGNVLTCIHNLCQLKPANAENQQLGILHMTQKDFTVFWKKAPTNGECSKKV